MENSEGSTFSMFQRNVPTTSSNASTSSKNSERCRRKLNYKNRFSNEENMENCKTQDKNILSIITMNDTRKILRNGAERITKTFNNVRTHVGSLSQIFKISTKRRQILEEGPMTPNGNSTPQTIAKQVLGRTPTKLYSPFSIESPYKSTTYDKENIPSQQLKVYNK